MWEVGKYAAVLADIHMPRMDGYDLARTIRAWEAEAGAERMPIVAVTANAMRGEEERCLNAGMDAYIPKPVSVVRLRDTLRRWFTLAPPTDATSETVDIGADRDSLRVRIGDDGAMIDDLLGRFYGSVGHATRTMASLLAVDDLPAVASAANKLQSAALLVGARDMGELAQGIEQAAASGDRDLCRGLLKRLLAAISVLRARARA